MDEKIIKLRLLDLLSMFRWHESYAEQLAEQAPARYAIVSGSTRDNSHWIDGFANTWADAAKIIATIDDEWSFVGVYDLSGKPGDPISTVSVYVVYEVGEDNQVDGYHGSHCMGFGFDGAELLGTYDTKWAEPILGLDPPEAEG